MIRILQVIGAMGSGGAETVLMNLYRNIDRTKIQFDFVVPTDTEAFYDKEILSLGGHIYHTEKFNVKNYVKYKKFWDDFFEVHREYHIVHGHINSSAAIYLGCTLIQIISVTVIVYVIATVLLCQMIINIGAI